MRSHAAAVAWGFRRRHRWGLIAVVCYLLALATLKLLALASGKPAPFDDEHSFAFVVVVPLGMAFMYFMALFSFGYSGDVGGRQSMYPARMFTLPVTSGALAGWPMLYGTAAMAVMWLATRFLGVWPSGIRRPLFWPAIMAAAILAWTQALAWMPYPIPGLRVIVTLLLLVSIDVVVFLAMYFETSEPVMLCILAPHLPLAYLVARLAVVRARRGDVPDGRSVFTSIGRMIDLLPRRRDHFPSAASAQAWFEWRRHGRALPALVGILLPFELALLFLFSDTPVLVGETLLGVLFTPPFVAVFVAATIRTPNLDGGDSYGLTPFMATRPLTSVSLVTTKLKVTLWSTLATWLLVIVAISLALRLSGTSAVAVDGGHQLIEIVGKPRAVVMGLLALSALVASTWKQLVQSLYIGMSGRAWLVKGSVFATLSLLTLIVVLSDWVLRHGTLIATLWDAIPWILAVLVCCKISAAAWIAVRLHDSRLLSDRTLVGGALCWDVAVLALYGLFVWLLPTLLFRTYLLALVAILAIPLARVSAAPLALSWNRHR